jgi:hypothetical protein
MRWARLKATLWLLFALLALPRFSDAEESGTVEAGAKHAATPDAPGVSQHALDEAKAALVSDPPRRDVARKAFEHAIDADDDRIAVAEAYFRIGLLEEEDGAFERALVAQRACMAKAPTSGWTRSARNRISWISARSEGHFVPLARLQRVRRDPTLSNDPAAIDALARDVEAFPAGRVRAEARMFVAEAWLTRSDKRDEAVAEFQRVADDPTSDSMDAAFASRHLVESLLSEGRIDDAANEVRAHHFDPKIVGEVARRVRRQTLRRVAIAELLTVASLALVMVARVFARRGRTARKSGPGALPRLPPAGFAALVTLGGVSVVAAAFALLDAVGSKLLVNFGL